MSPYMSEYAFDEAPDRHEGLRDARLAGTVGDVLGGLHEPSVNVGKLAGRVEVLEWAQTELQISMAEVRSNDRFADTRALEEFLKRVQDSLVRVQDGSGSWAGLIRTVVVDTDPEPAGEQGVPDVSMGS